MVDDINTDELETTQEDSITPEQEQVEEILEPTPYQNKYRNELDDKGTDTATEQQDTEEATPEERPVTAEEKAFKKRYDDLKRHYDKTLSKHKTEVTTLKTQIEQSTTQMLPPKDPKELEAWRKQYPDVYDVIESVALNQADARTKQLEEKYQFLQTQPTIQGWLYDNPDNADLCARAIDLYKMDEGITKSNKPKASDTNKEAAKAITSTRKSSQRDVEDKKIWTVEEISKLKPHQFDKHEKEIMQARRDGRIKA